MPADALQQLQLDIASVLTADDVFEDVRIIVSRPRSAEEGVMIENTINNALAGLEKYVRREAGQTDEQWLAACEADGKAGLCIIVMMSEGEVPHPGSPGPMLDLVQVIRVIENPLVNMGDDGTLITAEQGALFVLSALHQWDNDGRSAIYPDKSALKEVNLDNGLGYDVRFKRNLVLQPRTQVSRPIISIAADVMTLTCATASAAIYYTTDGSFPAELNDAAELYAAPVDVSALADGTAIRTCAFKAALRPSSIATTTL